jgi:hypothetical protein
VKIQGMDVDLDNMDDPEVMKQLRKAVRRTKRSARWEAIRSNPTSPGWFVAGAVQLIWVVIGTGVMAMVINSGLSAQGKVAGSLFTVAGVAALSIPTWVMGVSVTRDLAKNHR